MFDSISSILLRRRLVLLGKSIRTNRHTSKQKKASEKREREEIGKERANKTAKENGGEENERQMANNVNAREMGL